MTTQRSPLTISQKMTFFQFLLQETRALFSPFENGAPERMVTLVHLDGSTAIGGVN